MNVEDRGMLIGMVFGDGHISVRKRLKSGKYEYESSELVIKHSVAQQDYCLHKAALVRGIFGGKFTVRNGVTKLNEKEYYWVHFTKSHSYFRILKSLLYPEGKKRFTRQALEMLTPAGIALWYMDDGNARTNLSDKTGFVSSCSTQIATMCSKEEVDEIVNYFLRVHEIEFKVRFDRRQTEGKQYYIEANTANSQKFARLIKPYVIPSMLYKLAHVANLNTHECKAPVLKCSVCGNPTFTANRRKSMCSACYSRQNR